MTERERVGSVDRQRAVFVHGFLSGKAGRWVREESKVNGVKGLPVALRRQGLAVTTADLIRNRGDNPYNAVLEMLVEWLLKKAPGKPLAAWTGDARDAKNLLQAIADADRASYLAAQREALALLGQIKLYAEALHENYRTRDGHDGS